MKRLIMMAFAVLLLFSTVPAIQASASATDATQFASYTPDELLQQWYVIGDLLHANGKYPYVELEKGDVGYEVMALQTRLAELGYYKKEVVDNFGNGTFSAMQAFEKDNGLTVDGIASVSDQQLLFSGEVSAVVQQKTNTSAGTQTSTNSQTDAVSSATPQKP